MPGPRARKELRYWPGLWCWMRRGRTMDLKPGAKIKVIDRDKRKSQHESRKFTATVLKEYKHYWLVRNENGYKECLNKSLIDTGYIKIQEG
jgi:hypothetical protein